MSICSKILSSGSKSMQRMLFHKQVYEREPVFTYDSEKQCCVLRLRRGKWAGRTWEVLLSCCDSPRCGCANVDFHCVDIDPDTPEHAESVYFGLDAIERVVTVDTGRSESRSALDLATSVAAEFGEQEWQFLYQYLLEAKRKCIRTMDVTKVSLPDSPADITEDGSLVWFVDLFPYADCFEFDLDGEIWAVDDQYCVMPDCDCREVVLSFLKLRSSRDHSVIPKKQVPVARYDYKRNKVKVERKPLPGQPSLTALISALREAHPSIVEEVRRRHGQLKTIYLRTVLAQVSTDNICGSGTTIRRDEPKVGRNDPCPCGSGKKYKKCCA